MISYDSKQWRTLAKLHGSIIPKAFVYALLPAVIAFALKQLDNDNVLNISEWTVIQSAAWSVFTSVLGFLLVFRTGHCYTRFFACAAGLATMRTQMFEAASSLVAFTGMSNASKEDIHQFKTALIHLFSNFHAQAMTSVASTEHNRFEVIGLELAPTEFIRALQKVSPHHRFELVHMWINNLIVRHIDKDGLESGRVLNVPAPILSRVFNEMGNAVEAYCQVCQIMRVPIPFPYVQACVAFMLLYIVCTPLFMVSWAAKPLTAALLTLFSSACFLSLEMISAELENPFGADANDLPATSFQDEFNECLLLLLHPSLDKGFELNSHGEHEFGKRESFRSVEELCLDPSGDDFQEALDGRNTAAQQSTCIAIEAEEIKGKDKSIVLSKTEEHQLQVSQLDQLHNRIEEACLAKLDELTSVRATLNAASNESNTFIANVSAVAETSFEKHLLKSLNGIITSMAKLICVCHVHNAFVNDAGSDVAYDPWMMHIQV